MRILLLSSLLFLGVLSQAQEVKTIKFAELQKRILTANEPLTIFNFWATWCGPCVKEMPHFEAVNSNEKIKVVFVSLDFSDKLEKVKKFASDKGLTSEVLLLDETDYNSYIHKVSKEWTGAIPATLFVDEWGKTYFNEGDFTKEDLDERIKTYLN